MPTILLNKPYRVLCQFRDPDGRKTLADYVDTPHVYAAGRLDFDSEGMVVLTDDGKLQARISQPEKGLTKGYWAQVDGQATDADVRQLCRGVTLKDGDAKASSARLIDTPEQLWTRDPPIRIRKHIPTTWLDITLTEGRNRQVRRMTAAVGLPTLRLIRYRIGPWNIDELQPAMSSTMENQTAWQQLNR